MAAGNTEPRHPALRARRGIAFISLVLVVAAGLGVHALMPDTAATDIAGDALYAVAIYLALVLVAPRWPAALTGGAASAWCVAVEVFQLTGIPLALGAGFTPAMLVLGTVFDLRDLIVYLAAIALLTAADSAAARIAARRATI